MTAERRGGKAPASAEERAQERSDKRGRERERLRLTNGARAPSTGARPLKGAEEGARRRERRGRERAQGEKHSAPCAKTDELATRPTEQHGYY